jgi:hypothetical protein
MGFFFHCQSGMSFRAPLFAFMTLLFFHVVFLALRLYSYWKLLDIPMHFFGGAVVGMITIVLAHKYSRVTDWFFFLSVVSFTALAAVLWEFHEYLLDLTVVRLYGWSSTQPTLGDTMADLFFGLLGSVTVFIVFKIIRRIFPE